jgi:signal transduction histidine kinase
MAILAAFAIVVRTVFARTLYYQSIERLMTLGHSVAASVNYENGVLTPVDLSPQKLVEQKRALAWFDGQGEPIKQQGEEVLNIPLWPKRPIQIQKDRQILGVIVPIVDEETDRTVGYLRVSESLEAVNRELRTLDWGLGGGILIALTLSGVGGIWLTRQAMQPIEQSFQRLQQFTADASHELRSPLMAIKSNAAVALKYPEGIRDSDAEKFEAIASATRQMTHLTEDLLFLARNDRMPQQEWQPVNLTNLLMQLVQLYQPQAADQSLQLKFQLQESLSVMGNSAQLTRLFTNLIDNALHYTPAGGKVEVSAERSHAWVEVRVEDTGIGIDPEQIARVFDRFWRADCSRMQWEGGAGLGLSIAQSIAQCHKGQITVKSQPQVGSCFTVRLPGIDAKRRTQR